MHASHPRSPTLQYYNTPCQNLNQQQDSTQRKSVHHMSASLALTDNRTWTSGLCYHSFLKRECPRVDCEVATSAAIDSLLPFEPGLVASVSKDSVRKTLTRLSLGNIHRLICWYLSCRIRWNSRACSHCCFDLSCWRKRYCHFWNVLLYMSPIPKHDTSPICDTHLLAVLVQYSPLFGGISMTVLKNNYCTRL